MHAIHFAIIFPAMSLIVSDHINTKQDASATASAAASTSATATEATVIM